MTRSSQARERTRSSLDVVGTVSRDGGGQAIDLVAFIQGAFGQGSPVPQHLQTKDYADRYRPVMAGPGGVRWGTTSMDSMPTASQPSSRRTRSTSGLAAGSGSGRTAR